MASAAEQMAANVSWAALGKATELRQRIFFTIGLLIVYRLGTYIPVPGIDGASDRCQRLSAGQAGRTERDVGAGDVVAAVVVLHDH